MSATAVLAGGQRAVRAGGREAVRLDPSRAPLAEAVEAYARRGTRAFHVPGHKRGGAVGADLRALVGDTVLSHDVWLETAEYDAARGAAEELAADAYGAASAHLVAGGSTCANLAMLLATLRDGDEVVLSRDVHTSTLAGLVLSGARPVWVQPRVHEGLDLGLGVEPVDVAAALARHPRARAVGVVSPSYAGICSDLPGIVAAAHEAEALALVDAAWGAHHAFAAGLPVTPMTAGADAAVTSVHKTLPALSSGSLLLGGPRLDAARLAACVRMTQTTSPFLPLLASVDLARRALALDGPVLVGRAVELASQARARLARVPGLHVLDAADLGLPEERVDPLKLVVDVSGLEITGLAADRLLRTRFGVAPEGSDLTSVYLVVALGDTLDSVAALGTAFAALASSVGTWLPRQRPGRGVRSGAARRRSTGSVITSAPQVLTPRLAHQSASRAVPLRAAVGEVCAEIVTPYPPGIPVLVPGELVTADVVEYLADAVAEGVHVHGAADAALATLRVVAG